MLVVGPEIQPTRAAKYSKHRVIRFLMKKGFKRCRKIKNFGGSVVDQVSCSKEGLVPKF